MRFHSLILAAFITTSISATLCMIPMASSMSHQDHAAMPVSAADCDDCPGQDDRKTEPVNGSPCASGQCMTHDIADASTLIAASLASAPETLVASRPILSDVPQEYNTSGYQATAPPLASVTRTIVLRW